MEGLTHRPHRFTLQTEQVEDYQGTAVKMSLKTLCGASFLTAKYEVIILSLQNAMSHCVTCDR